MTTPIPIIDGESRALEVHRPQSTRDLVPFIDVDHEKARLDNFRAFIANVLDEKKGHFGNMPGVDRKFLQQPGAEIIVRALESRVEYIVLRREVDWDRDFVAFEVKAKLVHVLTGTVLGDADGAASSLEYAANCRGGRRAKKQDDDMVVNCPIHGTNLGKEGWEWGQAKGQKVYHVGCPKKIARGLEATYQNVLAKAEKRAMVKVVRTVACVSELFSQDSELIDRLDDAGQDTGAATSSSSSPKPATRAPQSKSKAAQPDASLRERLGVPEDASLPKDIAAEEVKAAMSRAREVASLDEIRAFFEDTGDYHEGDRLSGKHLTAWCDREGKTPNDWAEAVIARFKPAPVEGEVVDMEEVSFD